MAGHAGQDKITGQTAAQPLPATVIAHAATVDVVGATGQTLSYDRKLRTRMIEWRFTADDVARIRFAFSPMWELVLSLIVLRAPSRHALHLPWIRAVRPQLGALDLSEVFALVPVHGPVADFLTPPPTSPLPDFAAELDTVRRTPAAVVLADIVDVPGVPDTVQRRMRQDPSGALSRIADILQAYWDVALAAHWPRLLALLQADVLWRSRQLALGGAHGLFEDLHDTIVWHGDRLTAADHWNYTGALHGEGLLLVPSAMAWPESGRWSSHTSRSSPIRRAGSPPSGKPARNPPRTHSPRSSEPPARTCCSPSNNPAPRPADRPRDFGRWALLS